VVAVAWDAAGLSLPFEQHHRVVSGKFRGGTQSSGTTTDHDDVDGLGHQDFPSSMA
jgi:hypothetical protein